MMFKISPNQFVSFLLFCLVTAFLSFACTNTSLDDYDYPPISDGDGDAVESAELDSNSENAEIIDGDWLEGESDVIKIDVRLNVFPRNLEFGCLCYGEESERKIEIYNTGNVAIKILSIAFSEETSTDFSWSDDSSPTKDGEIEIQPGDSFEFAVTFLELANHPVSGRVIISTSLYSTEVIEIDLSSECKCVMTGEILTNPESLINFGKRDAGETHQTDLTIRHSFTNESNCHPVKLTLKLDEDTDDAFSLSQQSLNDVHLIPPGDVLVFEVYFNPLSEKEYSGKLLVQYVGRTIEINLLGEGLEPCIEITPAQTNMGTIAIGQNAMGSITIKNCGSTARLDDIYTSGALNLEISSLIDFPIDMDSFEKLEIDFIAYCVQKGEFVATIWVKFNGIDDSFFAEISGFCGEMDVGATPTYIDFGNVNIGSSASQIITVKQLDSVSDFEVQDIALTGDNTFSLSPTCFEPPANKAFDTEYSCEVSFTPSEQNLSQPNSATLSFSTTNGYTKELHSIPLTGNPVSGNCSFRLREDTDFSDTIGFGEVTLGTSESKYFIIENVGQAECVVTGLGVPLDGVFTFPALPDLPLNIAVDSSFVISINYSPVHLAPDQGSFAIQTNNIPVRGYAFYLIGSGIAPVLQMQPTATELAPYEFEDTYKDSCTADLFHIRNLGTGKLIVDTYFELSRYSALFFNLGDLSFPSNGLPDGQLRNYDATGDQITFAITFCPKVFSSDYVFKGKLFIHSNSINETEKTFHLWGKGIIGRCYTPTEHLFPVEKCDNWDNDCNGITDEGFGLGLECSGIGECGEGLFECDPNYDFSTICSTMPDGTGDQSSHEICDTLDNDCDGMKDEDFGTGQQCVGLGECGLGWIQCDPRSYHRSICSTMPYGTGDQSSHEICDGLDNDCDGVTDEGCP